MNRTKLILSFCLTIAILPAFASAPAKGQKIYESNCAACHGKKGEGRGSAFPPLFKSDYIANRPQVLLQTLIKGINGPIKVNGKSYNGFMPATAMNDADLAALSSYVMTAFGNGGQTITEQDVKKFRSKK